MHLQGLLRAILFGCSDRQFRFDVDRFEKTDTRFGIWLDEKKVQFREDKYNNDVIAYGFGDYHTIGRDKVLLGDLREGFR